MPDGFTFEEGQQEEQARTLTQAALAPIPAMLKAADLTNIGLSTMGVPTSPPDQGFTFEEGQTPQPEAPPQTGEQRAALDWQRMVALQQQGLLPRGIRPRIGGGGGEMPDTFTLPGGTQLQFTGGMQLPRIQAPPGAGKLEQTASGIVNLAASIPNFIASREGIGTMLVPEALPARLAKPALGLIFGGLMAKGTGEAAGEFSVHPTWQSGVELAGSGLLAGLAARSGYQGLRDYASRVKEAAKVHGNVPPQPGEGPGQVPIEESGRGILPPEEAQETQVLLSEALEQNKRLGIGHQVDVVSGFGPDDYAVFKADMRQPDGTPGRIQVSAPALKEWLASIPEKDRPQALNAALSEEGIHATVTPEQALAYLDTLTPAEIALGKKLYLGGVSEHAANLNYVRLGHELLRQRMQRILRLKPTELAETSGREKWSRASIELIARIIRSIREIIGTRAAKAGGMITDQLLDQYERNLAGITGERITHAAYMDPEGNVTTGAHHPGILEQLGMGDLYPTRESRNTPDFGYMTSGGQFVTRDQAAPIAEAAGQKLTDFDEKEGRPMPHSDEIAAPADQTKAVSEQEPADQPFMINRFKVDQEIDRLDKVPAADFSRAYDQRVGLTQSAWNLGRSVTDPQQAEALKRSQKLAHEEFSRALQTKDLNLAAAAAFKGQFFREAYEAATGTGSAGEALKAIDPNYKAPVPSEQMAAMINRRRKAEKETPQFYLPPVERGQARPTGEIPGVPSVFKPKIGTGQQIFRSAHSFVQEATDALERDPNAEPPKFGRFFAQAKKDFPGIGRGEAAELWDRAVGIRLRNASGDALKAIARSLGIKTPDTIANAPSAKEQARAAALEKSVRPGAAIQFPEMRKEMAETRKDVKLARETGLARQRVRQSVARRIYERLVEPAYPEAALARKEVFPEDVARLGTVDLEPKERASGLVEPEVWDVMPGDLKNPVTLGRKLTSGSRRRQTDPVSVTKRLTLLRDEETGKAYLVSTYEHGRAGAMLVDPALTTVRAHRPLSKILEKYRPVSSFLLDEPVKDFRQEFESLGDFENRFGTDVREEHRGGGFGEELTREGEPEAPALFAQRHQPLTDAEANAVVDHIFDVSASLESPADIKASWLAIADDIQAGRMPPRQAYSGWLKLATALDEREPGLSDKDFADKLAQQIYDTHKASKNYADFQRRTMEQGPAPGDEMATTTPEGQAAVVPPARAAAETGARELTLPRFARRAEPTGRTGGPVPELPAPRPPEMLKPEEAKRIERLATEEFVEPKTVGEAMSLVGIKDPAELNDVPAMINRFRKATREEFDATRRDIGLLIKNNDVGNAVAAGYDRVGKDSNIRSRQAEFEIRLQSINKPGSKLMQFLKPWLRGNADVLHTARALVEAGSIRQDGSFDKTMARSKLTLFKFHVERGRVNVADFMRQNPGYKAQRLGKAWLRALDEAEQELDYGLNHLDDVELQRTAAMMKGHLDTQIDLEIFMGYDISRDPHYVPHRFDAQLWSGKSILFREPKVLGKKFREARAFDNQYEALEKGPYIPVTRDGASLVAHRLRQGRNMINRDLWIESLKHMVTADGKPVAIAPVKMTSGAWGSNRAEYKEIGLPKKGKPLVIHEDFAPLIRQLVSANPIADFWLSRGLVNLEANLKHTLLIGDFFHMGRVAYYAASISGLRAGWKGGWTVLDIPERAVNEAVRRGVITQKAADWGREQVQFGNRTIRRRELAIKFTKAALNVGQIQDALYKDMVTHLTPSAGPIRRAFVAVTDPSVGRYNRFLFDRFTRGLMLNSAITEFERQTKANPRMDPNKLLVDIGRDINAYFGNLGHQGWLKADWQQDLARLFFLAPQWVEGLLRKEFMGAYPRMIGGTARVLGLAPEYRKGLEAYGTLPRSIGRGLAAMFLITQAANIITRRQPTWMNPEKEHKFDAAITLDGQTFWFSPMALFNEISHDVFRLVQDKPTVADALAQIVGNKESPIIRTALVGLTGRTPTGTVITSSAGRLGQMAQTMAPAPITFGRYARAAGHMLAPGMIEPNVPGQIPRQMAATFGLKIEPGKTPLQETQKMAREFLKEQGREDMVRFQETDQPSYARMRQAVRSQDQHGTWKLLEQLRKQGHTDDQILKTMKAWQKRPFTGSKEMDELLRYSTDDHGRELMAEAEYQRQQEYQRFLDYFMSEPRK